MKLSKRIRVTRRGYRILAACCPGLIRAKVLSAAVESLSPFVTIWFSAKIINEIAGARDVDRLTLYVLLVIGINFVLSMVKNAMDKVVTDKEGGMWGYFSKVFSDKQMEMDFVDLENPDVQQSRQKAQENLFMFGNGLAQLVWDTPELVRMIVGIAASVSMTASLFTAKTGRALLDSPLWIAALLALVAVSGFVSARLRRREQKVFEKWTDGTVWFNRAFMFYGQELYFNIARAKDVRLYRQDRTADRQMQMLDEHNRGDNGMLRKMSGCQGLLVLTQSVCNALCYLFVVAKAGLGAFAVGSIVQYVGALIRLVQSFGSLIFTETENRVYTEHIEGLLEYLDLPNRKKQGDRPVDESAVRGSDPAQCVIEFKNVSFRYPGTEEYVLKNVSTKLHAGKRQALVGENGAGKTTFVKLLCRLYDPTEGEILLNGVDIREYDYDQYLKLFSFVFQDFKLFALPLGQNLAADVDVDPEKAEACLKKVSFFDRYKAMPDGLGTFLYKDLSEDGVEISGGEAQKLALARALYKDAPIVVLDEPTAALDPVAEEEIYRNFSAMVEDKTAVYISHRLSSCRFCDEITVFDRGRIVQKGSHAELVRDADGKYAQLWNAQAKYYRKTE